MLLRFAQSIQATHLSAFLAGSTWAYPIIGALHVLGIAWFGGAVLLSILRRQDSEMRPRTAFLWIGVVVMLLSGVLLVLAEPLRCLISYAFGAKMLLLVTVAAVPRMRTKVRVPLILTLWAGVLLASRAIAFF